MKKEPQDKKKFTLSVSYIGSEVEDAKVTCIKVFCPRKANNFVSFLCDGRFTVAGKSKVDIVEGGTYIISGKVTEWNNRPQVTLKKIRADEEAGDTLLIASFLADNISGLGKTTAEALAERFGSDILKILTETPELASSAVSGLSSARAMAICDQITQEYEFFRQGLEAKLMGFSQAQIKMLKKLDRLNCEEIRNKPYKLMGHGIAGFELLDRIALREGMSPVEPERIAAALYQACMYLHEETKSTALKPQDVRKRALEYVNIHESKLSSEQFSEVFRAGAALATEEKKIAVYKYDSGKCAVCDAEDPEARFASMSYFASELAVGRCILEAIAMKRLAIISGYTGIRDILSKENFDIELNDNFGGKHLEEKEVRDISKKIKKLDEKLISEIIEYNYERAKKELDIDNNIYIIDKENYKYDIDTSDILMEMIKIKSTIGKLAEYRFNKMENDWKDHLKYKEWMEEKENNNIKEIKELKDKIDNYERTISFRVIRKIKRIVRKGKINE